MSFPRAHREARQRERDVILPVGTTTRAERPRLTAGRTDRDAHDGAHARTVRRGSFDSVRLKGHRVRWSRASVDQASRPCFLFREGPDRIHKLIGTVIPGWIFTFHIRCVQDPAPWLIATWKVQ